MKTVLTMTGAPGPMAMEEVCVFEVVDGKAVLKEQFFYTPRKQGA